MKGSPLTRGRIILQSREEIVRYVHISVMRISAQIRRTTDQGERYRVRGQRSVPARVTEMPPSDIQADIPSDSYFELYLPLDY